MKQFTEIMPQCQLAKATYYKTVQTVQKGAIEHQPGLVTAPKILGDASKVSIFKHMCDE